jgi:hypothetical protein
LHKKKRHRAGALLCEHRLDDLRILSQQLSDAPLFFFEKKGIGLALSFVNIAWTTTYVEILKSQRLGL